MVRTERVDKFLTAPQVWCEILRENGVALIACARYEDRPHGVPSNNIPINFDVYELCGLLGERQDPEPGWIFAMSSLVTTQLGDCFGELWTRESLWTDNHNVQALLCVDFDCPGSSENLAMITRVLGGNFGNWSLLQTDGGFHFIDEHLIPPQHIPFHYGRLMTMFVSETDEESGRFFGGVGRRLMSGWFDPAVVRWEAQALLAGSKHYDESNKKGYVIPPDGRYMGHVMLELRRFLAQRQMGFGFLRVSGRGDNPPPLLRARQKDKQVVVYET